MRPCAQVTLQPARPQDGGNFMDWKLEVVVVPVSDVDRAKIFYIEKTGFNLDVDYRAAMTFASCS
jgi:hypothetical protein